MVSAIRIGKFESTVVGILGAIIGGLANADPASLETCGPIIGVQEFGLCAGFVVEFRKR